MKTLPLGNIYIKINLIWVILYRTVKFAGLYEKHLIILPAGKIEFIEEGLK